MTNENAIRWLKDLLKSDLPMEQYQKALEKGIEALEPSGMSMNDYDALWDIVTKMPSVKQDPCGDAISRQAVQDYIAKYLSQYLYNDVREAVEVIDEYIGELPSVNPQSKIGHWIAHPKGIYAHLVCDKCLSNAPYDCRTHYCPNCGCRMIEPQESEEV